LVATDSGFCVLSGRQKEGRTKFPLVIADLVFADQHTISAKISIGITRKSISSNSVNLRNRDSRHFARFNGSHPGTGEWLKWEGIEQDVLDTMDYYEGVKWRWGYLPFHCQSIKMR
jgi:hypothetical protein